jgi:hypothetical protein
MRRRLYPPFCAGLVVAGLALLPSGASAQTTDPGAPGVGTPPANQYEIPLQAGRRDAAPSNAKRDPRAGSLYRTDNNFGSSSIIPGDPRDGAPRARAADPPAQVPTSSTPALHLSSPLTRLSP